MNRNRKKVLICFGTFVAVLLIVFIVGAWTMFGTFVIAANSIDKLEDGLYSMEYEGDYGFDEFLADGGATSDSAVADYLVSFLSHGFYKIESDVQTGEFGCSTICTRDEHGVVLFGRNYDWKECRAIIVHTVPENGYESISTCCLDFLGFDENYAPDGSMIERMQTLAAIYVPMDGMNEKGLMVADLMAGDNEATHQQTDKVDLTTTTAIRLLLDKAATVDEAVALLRRYDMNSSMDTAHHLSVADASGKSVVVEYVDGQMIVTETKIVTNHYLADCGKQGVGSEQSHLRFDTLATHTGAADDMAVRDLLESVAQKNYPQTEGDLEKTMWSIVYCPEGRCADFYFAENYEHSYGLILQEKGGYLKLQED
ncbi:MAG: linear amide C-N hydrolase [Lachnospiraceae bacterium]|nr:linear amide C-N hydrolase [Lachnospiraceae bacterium]